MPAKPMDDLRPSIEQAEAEFLGNLALLDDALLQYEYVLSFVSEVDELPEAACTDECKVAGCASNAWMLLSREDGCLSLRLNADALIIKGLLGVLTWLLDGRPLPEVAVWKSRLLDDPSLKPLLNTDRRHGVASIITAITGFCRCSAGCSRCM